MQDGASLLLPRGWRVEHTKPIRGVSSRWNGFRVATIVEPKGDRFCSVTAQQRLADEAALSEQGDGSAPPEDANRSFCEVCGGGGLFLCCEGCPAVLHKACVTFEFPSCPIPKGAFYCPACLSSGRASASESSDSSSAGAASDSESDGADFEDNTPWHERLGRRVRGPSDGRHGAKGKRKGKGKAKAKAKGKGKSAKRRRRMKQEAPVLLEKEAATVPNLARRRVARTISIDQDAGSTASAAPHAGAATAASPLSLVKRRKDGKPRGAVFLARAAPRPKGAAAGDAPVIAKLSASHALRLTPAQVAARKVLPPGAVAAGAGDDGSSGDDEAVPATLKPMAVCADGNEAFCSVCGVGGAIVCCDGCPASFHEQCCFQLRAASDDADEWACPSCTVLSCYEQVAASYRQHEPTTKSQAKRYEAAADMACRFAALVKVRMRACALAARRPHMDLR